MTAGPLMGSVNKQRDWRRDHDRAFFLTFHFINEVLKHTTVFKTLCTGIPFVMVLNYWC